jgi:hypothetical protein
MRFREFKLTLLEKSSAVPGDPATDPLYDLKLKVANKIRELPPEENTAKALQEIEDLLSHVNAGGRKGYIDSELAAIDDKDVQRARTLLAKYVHSLEMNGNQRKDLFTRWKNDELVNRKLLLSPGKHSIPEIINGYDDPNNPAIKELTNDLAQVAALGQGKGEFLLSVLSKSITKLHKGDLEVEGVQVEVKTMDVGGGRFYDQEVRPAQNYAESVRVFLKKWANDINLVFGKVASSGLKLVDLMTLGEQLSPENKKSYFSSVRQILSSIFPGMDVSPIINGLRVGNIGAAKQAYAVINLDYYRNIKKEDEGILFIDLSRPVAEFVFFRNASELSEGGLRLHAGTVYPVTSDPRNAYPQMRILPTKAASSAPEETPTPTTGKTKAAKNSAQPAAGTTVPNTPPSAPSLTPKSKTSQPPKI